MSENMVPQHIAIIMDGNGRWAKSKGLPRSAGHKQGAQNIRDMAIICKRAKVKQITCYAFSTENWKRSIKEVEYLCKLPRIFFSAYLKELQKEDVKVTFIGEIEKFPLDTQKVIKDAVEATKNNKSFILCLAINYGSQREIVLAAQAYAQDVLANNALIELNEESFNQYLMSKNSLAIDLLIRTSGEQRLSNFLLYQLAYAELIFSPVAWPAFDEAELLRCIEEYLSRERRFGGVL